MRFLVVGASFTRPGLGDRGGSHATRSAGLTDGLELISARRNRTFEPPEARDRLL